MEITVIEGLTPRDLSIGDGFSFDNLSENPRIFNEDIKISTNDTPGFALDFYYISDRSSLRNALTLNSTVTYKSIGTRFESYLGINTEEIINTNNLTICLIGSTTAFVSKSAPDKTQVKSSLLQQYKENPDEFCRNFGDHYIESIRYGSRIYIFLTIINVENAQSKNFLIQANGKIGNLSGNAAFKDEFFGAKKSGRVSLSIKGYGLPYNDLNFSSLFNYDGNSAIEIFFTKTVSDLLADRLPAKANAVPISYEVSSLKGILPKINSRRIEINEIRMRDYLNAYYKYESEKEKIKLILNKASILGLSPAEMDTLNELDAQLTNEIEKIANCNNDCFENKSNCKSYTVKEIALHNQTYYNSLYKIIPFKCIPFQEGAPVTPEQPLIFYRWKIEPHIFELIRGREIAVEIAGCIRSAEPSCNNPHFQTRLNAANLIGIANDFQINGEVKRFYVKNFITVPQNGIIEIDLINFNSWCSDGRHKLRLIPYNFVIQFFLKEMDSEMLLMNKASLQ